MDLIKTTSDMNFKLIVKFLTEQNLIDQNRLTMILFYLAEAKEYGRLTQNELKRAASKFERIPSENLFESLQKAEETILSSPEERLKFYVYCIFLYSFGKPKIDRFVFLSKIKSYLERN